MLFRKKNLTKIISDGNLQIVIKLMNKLQKLGLKVNKILKYLLKKNFKYRIYLNMIAIQHNRKRNQKLINLLIRLNKKDNKNYKILVQLMICNQNQFNQIYMEMMKVYQIIEKIL